ncbi:MAG: DNA-processing protein DprA [Brumimicrobium sp.]|nr:DNA-processing protein DprA [Brumimicrobium sp.]
MKTNQLIYRIALTLLDNVGPKSARTLVAYTGSPEAVFRDGFNIRSSIPGFSKERFRKLNTKKALEEALKILEFVQKHDLKTHFYLDDDFPYRLKQCADAPLLLYSKGNMAMNPSKSLAIVGTRNMTSYGEKLIRDTISFLKPFNVQIVSGLAYGVDICAHRFCLEYGVPTVGVLGHGLDRIYPQHHRGTARIISESQGGLLTEFPNGTNPDRENFPKRNRIVAGMTDATVIIESGVKGGSLITANLAFDYDREVFAYPGNIDRPYSQGCNHLIHAEKARLIRGPEDIVNYLNWEIEDKPKAVQTDIFKHLDHDEKKVVGILKEFEKMSLDLLALRLKTPVSILSSLLLNLELKGIISSYPGKKYALSADI